MRRGRVAQRRIRETLNLLKITSRYVNHIRLHRSTSPEHMKKLCEICMWLRQHDKDFVTEAEFRDGGRADIVVLEDQVAIEIGHTESRKRFEKKEYPIMKIFVGTNEEWRGL